MPISLVRGRLERDGAVRRRKPRTELARLRHGAAGQLRPADAGREAQVVLDPPRRARLPSERGALDHERVEPLGRAVDGRAESARPGADDEQVDLLARRELGPDAERPRHVAPARRLEPKAARHHDDWELVGAQTAGRRHGRRLVGVAPDVRDPIAPHGLDDGARGLR